MSLTFTIRSICGGNAEQDPGTTFPVCVDFFLNSREPAGVTAGWRAFGMEHDDASHYIYIWLASAPRSGLSKLFMG